MRKPKILKKGACIGVIAPSGFILQDEIEPAISHLMDMGFQVKKGKSVFQKHTYLAGEDNARLRDLHVMFQDDEVSAIFCARGGYGALRLLPSIDYGLISQKPKILIGYSDITALLISFLTKSGIVTFHGPLLKELFKSKEENLNHLMDFVTKGIFTEVIIESNMVVREGKAEGILMGGNLSTLVSLMGTPFIKPLDDVILFIEDKGEQPYRLDRMIHQLIMSEFFPCVRALLIGQFVDCGSEREIDELIRHISGIVNIPIVKGLPFGHGDQNITIPVGIRAEVDTSGGLYLKEPCFEYH